MSRPRDIYHSDRGWQPNPGRICVHPETLVRFQYACGQLSTRDRIAGQFIWKKRGWDFDIRAYRVVQEAQEQ